MFEKNDLKELRKMIKISDSDELEERFDNLKSELTTSMAKFIK